MKALFILTLLSAMATQAQQSNVHFSHTVATTASREAIWKIWTDVPNWKIWDSGLKDARLNGDFADGSTGKIIPNKGPASKFVIYDVSENNSYSFKTKIPLGWLVVSRYMQEKNGMFSFTHEVRFTGPLKGLLGKRLGKKFREMLPNVMLTIKDLAEN